MLNKSDKLIKITKNDFNLLLASVLIVSFVFAGFYAKRAYGEAVNLTATIQSSLTFTTATDQFGTLTPGTYSIATTTLIVTTNNVAGWNITLSGDDQGTNNTVMDLDTDPNVGITDQTEWIPGSATTTPGNAVTRANLDNSGDVLAFRVMSASSTNGTAFLSTAWWGNSDADGTALWAGIASSTVQRKIGDAGSGSYSSSPHINTVQYYLDVPATQKTGNYSGGLTYTATAN